MPRITFTFSDELKERKLKLPQEWTWNKILEAGVQAAEEHIFDDDDK